MCYMGWLSVYIFLKQIAKGGGKVYKDCGLFLNGILPESEESNDEVRCVSMIILTH